MDWHPIQGERKYSSLLPATHSVISCSSMGLLAQMSISCFLRAADWKLDQPDWTGRLRVCAKGKECYIKIEDKTSGELYQLRVTSRINDQRVGMRRLPGRGCGVWKLKILKTSWANRKEEAGFQLEAGYWQSTITCEQVLVFEFHLRVLFRVWLPLCPLTL